MIRNLLFSTLLGLAFLLPVPTLAQKAVFAPEVESLVMAQSPESVKASLRQDAGARRSAPTAPAKTAPSEDKPKRDDLRMLFVALLLMVAIAIRRYRSDAR